MNPVLYLKFPSATSSSTEKLVGAREIFEKAHFNLRLIDTHLTAGKIRELVKFWNPAGMIVECGERTDAVSAFPEFADMPIVYIDHDPSALPRDSFCVCHDSRAAGAAAAKALILTGHRNFAFVPFPGTWQWNEDRRRGFVDALRLNDFTCSVFDSTKANIDSPAYTRELRRFLRTLATPCAVFVANDHPAEKVIAEAKTLGLAIPDQLAVLGVDDYEPICEHTKPRLSSIKPDFRGGGNLAAMMLVAAIRDGRKFRGERIRRYGTLQIIRRESTNVRRRSSDPDVDAALELIRNEACNGLAAETVMKAFPCSRPLAAARFRRATGHSILEEIHAVRLERAKELLSYRSQKLYAISDFCGFKSPNSLRKFFLRKTGMTMSAWRNRGNDIKDRTETHSPSRRGS